MKAKAGDSRFLQASQVKARVQVSKEEGRPSRWKDGLARSFVHGSTLQIRTD